MTITPTNVEKTPPESKPEHPSADTMSATLLADMALAPVVCTVLARNGFVGVAWSRSPIGVSDAGRATPDRRRIRLSPGTRSPERRCPADSRPPAEHEQPQECQRDESENERGALAGHDPQQHAEGNSGEPYPDPGGDDGRGPPPGPGGQQPGREACQERPEGAATQVAGVSNPLRRRAVRR